MNVRTLARVALLLAVTLVVQMAGLPQPITGPAVNAMLILATLFVGPWGAVAIGLLTPWVAFLRGTLPAPLGPAIPFIIAGNALLVLVYWAVLRLSRSRPLGPGSWAGLLLAAFAKYAVIAGAVQFLLHLPPKLAGALGLPQLFTALIGGFIALLVGRALLGLGVEAGCPGVWRRS